MEPGADDNQVMRKTSWLRVLWATALTLRDTASPRLVAATDEPFALARRHMVAEQLSGPGRNITNARVLRAMGKVPRHEFVPGPSRSLAYQDCPLPIGHGQTISQPYIVAFMTEQLDPSRPIASWKSAPAPATRPPSWPNWSHRSIRSRSLTTWPGGRPATSSAWVTPMCRCGRVTAAKAGPRLRHSRRSWSPVPRRKFPNP